MMVYTSLVRLLDQSPYLANFCSSYAGLLFVYLTALRYVFRRASRQGIHFFVLYWAYHFVSITLYSAALQATAAYLGTDTGLSYSEIWAKLIITPANLATNFLFMKLLTLRMRTA